MAVAEKLSEVDIYLDTLDHTRKAEVLALRDLILNAVPGLTETVRWNAPNYGRGDADRITMRLHPGNRLQLILHRGAKAGADDLFRFEDPDKLISWAAPDRGVITIKDAADLATKTAAMSEIFRRWVAMTTR
jgi:hypothetical protein